MSEFYGLTTNIRPISVVGQKCILRVPERGIASHSQMYLKAKLSKFSITHVFGRLATVKC